MSMMWRAATPAMGARRIRTDPRRGSPADDREMASMPGERRELTRHRTGLDVAPRALCWVLPRTGDWSGRRRPSQSEPGSRADSRWTRKGAAMARADLNGRSFDDSSGRLRRSESVRLMVDSWIDLLERDVTGLPGAANGVPAADEARPDAGSNGDANGMPDSGAAQAEQRPGAAGSRRAARAGESGERTAAGHAEHAAGLHDGVIVTFRDAPGGQVVLARAGGRFRHLGTVFPRGPAAPGRAAYLELGLTDEQARALESVLAWFGAPFDAVNLDDRHPRRLTWGIWGFAGRALAGCLAAWKQRAPEGFAGLLARHGIDVAVAADGSAELARPLGRGGSPLVGERAEQTIAGEAGLVAALARAGREPAVQLAQLEALVARAARPALGLALPGGGPAASDVVKSARGLAAVLYVGLRFGRRGLARLAPALGKRRTAFDDESAFLSALSDSLQEVDREADAHHVLRILSSPELDAA